MLISVIIPVYNGEQYLQKCLNSVKSCPIDEMECIMINDGSKDNTEKICTQFVEEDSRFKLINKENTGVSDTRNVGIAKAIGKYVFFIDADDYIAQDAWIEIIAHANLGKYDMVAFSYFNQFYNGKIMPMHFDETDDKKKIDSILLSTAQLNTCWGKLLNSEIIRKYKIFFQKDLQTCEDTIFILDFVQYSNKCLLVPRIAVYYRIHSGGVMQKTDHIKRMADMYALFLKRESYLQKNYDKSVEQLMRAEFFSILTNLLCFYAQKRRVQDVSAIFIELLKSNEFDLLFEKVDNESIVKKIKKIEFALIMHKWYTSLILYFRVKACIWPLITLTAPRLSI